jgi:hypothetical protein
MVIEERIVRVEEDIKELKTEVKKLRWWIVGTGIAMVTLVLMIIQLQAGWIQENINAHQKTSEARMDEFRRDSDRNYNLALKALERSLGQPQPAQVPPPTNNSAL